MSLRRNRLDEGALAELDALDAALRGEENDLSALVADVRDAAPRPTPAFLAELDARVREGFPPREDAAGSGAAAPAPRRRRRRALAAGAVASALLALVVGTAVIADRESPSDVAEQVAAPPASTADDGESGLLAAPSPGAEAAPSAGPAPAAGAVTTAPSRGSTADGRRQRSVERSATLDLTVNPDDVQSTADAVVRATDRLGGIVQTSSISVGEGQPGEARFELRVPSERLDEALAAYSRLGSVASRTQDAQDITNAVVSIEDRLSDARAERRALLRALARADTPGEIASLRARLRLARSQIAELERQLRAVRARADRSTIALTIRGDERSGGGAPDDGSWSLGDAVRDALRLLEVAAGVVVVGAAVLLPLAALALLGVAGGRAIGRRRRERGLDAA